MHLRYDDNPIYLCTPIDKYIQLIWNLHVLNINMYCNGVTKTFGSFVFFIASPRNCSPCINCSRICASRLALTLSICLCVCGCDRIELLIELVCCDEENWTFNGNGYGKWPQNCLWSILLLSNFRMRLGSNSFGGRLSTTIHNIISNLRWQIYGKFIVAVGKCRIAQLDEFNLFDGMP